MTKCKSETAVTHKSGTVTPTTLVITLIKLRGTDRTAETVQPTGEAADGSLIVALLRYWQSIFRRPKNITFNWS